MSLLHHRDTIPPDDRCPACEGSGDRWAEVYCCSGDECACGGQPFMEPVDECERCGGTGIATPEARERFDAEQTRAGRIAVRHAQHLADVSAGRPYSPKGA